MIVVSRNRQARPVLDGHTLQRVAEVAFAQTGSRDGTVELEVGTAFVNDAQMTEFHRDFLNKSTTTDVLSFPSDDARGEQEDPGYRGDVIVCTDQAARQARDLGIPYRAELVILTLHGFLHLLGHDHTRDRGEMTRLEEALRPLALRGGFR